MLATSHGHGSSAARRSPAQQITVIVLDVPQQQALLATLADIRSQVSAVADAISLQIATILPWHQVAATPSRAASAEEMQPAMNAVIQWPYETSSAGDILRRPASQSAATHAACKALLRATRLVPKGSALDIVWVCVPSSEAGYNPVMFAHPTTDPSIPVYTAMQALQKLCSVTLRLWVKVPDRAAHASFPSLNSGLSNLLLWRHLCAVSVNCVPMAAEWPSGLVEAHAWRGTIRIPARLCHTEPGHALAGMDVKCKHMTVAYPLGSAAPQTDYVNTSGVWGSIGELEVTDVLPRDAIADTITRFSNPAPALILGCFEDATAPGQALLSAIAAGRCCVVLQPRIQVNLLAIKPVFFAYAGAAGDILIASLQPLDPCISSWSLRSSLPRPTASEPSAPALDMSAVSLPVVNSIAESVGSLTPAPRHIASAGNPRAPTLASVMDDTALDQWVLQQLPVQAGGAMAAPPTKSVSAVSAALTQSSKRRRTSQPAAMEPPALVAPKPAASMYSPARGVQSAGQLISCLNEHAKPTSVLRRSKCPDPPPAFKLSVQHLSAPTGSSPPHDAHGARSWHTWQRVLQALPYDDARNLRTHGIDYCGPATSEGHGHDFAQWLEHREHRLRSKCVPMREGGSGGLHQYGSLLIGMPATPIVTPRHREATGRLNARDMMLDQRLKLELRAGSAALKRSYPEDNTDAPVPSSGAPAGSVAAPAPAPPPHEEPISQLHQDTLQRVEQAVAELMVTKLAKNFRTRQPDRTLRLQRIAVRLTMVMLDETVEGGTRFGTVSPIDIDKYAKAMVEQTLKLQLTPAEMLTGRAGLFDSDADDDTSLDGDSVGFATPVMRHPPRLPPAHPMADLSSLLDST